METLVAILQHKSQSYRRKGLKIHHDQFGLPPSNCRSFVAATFGGSGSSGGGSLKAPEKGKRSSPVLITQKPLIARKDIDDEFSNSELWAGLGYSNSLLPSSLPIETEVERLS